MKLSIIIPIYNSDKFLSNCIESIISQKIDFDYEIILVNDGSTDNSLKICKDYSKKYKNIYLINEINSGVSVARNAGLRKAKGEYIFFIDSDDLLYPECMKNLKEVLNKGYEIILGNYVSWNVEKNERKIVNDISKISIKGSSIKELCLEYALRDWQIPWNPYQAIYSREVILNNNVFFNPKYTVGEDCDFFFRYIKYVKKIKIVQFNYVLYRIEPQSDSLINNYNFKNINSQLEVFFKYFEMARQTNNNIMEKYFADRFANVVILIAEIKNKSDRQKCIAFVNKHYEIIKSTTNKIKYKLLIYSSKFLGINLGIIITEKFRHIIRKYRNNK